MESMLYTEAMINLWIAGAVAALLLLLLVAGVLRRQWFPEGLQMSGRAALRLNAWALVALAVAFAARRFLRQPDWSDPLRIAVALAPLVPGSLYVLVLWRWIRGLDELQRRIQIGAVAFVAAIMGFALMGVDLLQGAGYLRQFHWGWEFAYALCFLLWMVGCALSTRRYA
jgi:hypothetical protein